MKGIRRLTITRSVLAITVYVCSAATAWAADSSSIADIVSRQIEPIMAEYDIPGMSVAITVHGEDYFFNYGIASVDEQAPVTKNTLFEIGSLSKIFTAMLGAHAAAVGQISLDDPPAKYMPELEGTALNRASLLNLATYTAGGLPLQFPDSVQTVADTPEYFAQFSPAAAPGELRRYSNPSMGLFGYLTSQALASDFPGLVKEILFLPLGLENSYITVPLRAMQSYAWGYDAHGRAIRVNPGVFDAQAYGVKSTASDLIRLVKANIRPDDFDEPMQQTIKSTQVGYFRVGEMLQGLGWESYSYPVTLDQLLAGNSTDMALRAHPASPQEPPLIPAKPRLFNKTGSTSGFGAYIAFVPQREIGIVLLANKNYPVTARITAAHTIFTELRN